MPSCIYKPGYFPNYESLICLLCIFWLQGISIQKGSRVGCFLLDAHSATPICCNKFAFCDSNFDSNLDSDSDSQLELAPLHSRQTSSSILVSFSHHHHHHHAATHRLVLKQTACSKRISLAMETLSTWGKGKELLCSLLNIIKTNRA